MSEVEQFAGQAGSRCQGYWLLSRLFLEPPTPALLADMQSALASAEGESAALQADLAFTREAVAAASADLEGAAVEYTRRLVTVAKDSGEALPFEAHFLEGRSPGEATERLVRRMGAWGYRSELVESTPPDHLGAELRLMALLCNDEREAWLGDQAFAVVILAQQRELLSAHLAKWAPEYCRALAGRAEHSYVQAIARITASSLEADVAAFEEICAAANAVAPEGRAALYK